MSYFLIIALLLGLLLACQEVQTDADTLSSLIQHLFFTGSTLLVILRMQLLSIRLLEIEIV